MLVLHHYSSPAQLPSILIEGYRYSYRLRYSNSDTQDRYSYRLLIAIPKLILLSAFRYVPLSILKNNLLPRALDFDTQQNNTPPCAAGFATPVVNKYKFDTQHNRSSPCAICIRYSLKPNLALHLHVRYSRTTSRPAFDTPNEIDHRPALPYLILTNPGTNSLPVRHGNHSCYQFRYSRTKPRPAPILILIKTEPRLHSKPLLSFCISPCATISIRLPSHHECLLCPPCD